MELVQQKSGNGVRWVVVGAGEEVALGRDGGVDFDDEGGRDARSLDCTGMTECGDVEEGSRVSVVIPWIHACVDPQEKWWVRLRGNPKRSGEISQAAFLLKAETMGFDVALPWGDNQKFDFLLRHRSGRAIRVQVKGTGRLHRRGYEVQPVHATRRGGKKRYTKRDIDVIAAHVQPEDAWYLIPIEKVGRAKSLRLYPGIPRRMHPGVRARGRRGTRNWERWRERWDVLGER